MLVSAAKRDSVKCPKCGTKTLSRGISTFAVMGAERGPKSGGDSCTSCSSSSCYT